MTDLSIDTGLTGVVVNQAPATTQLSTVALALPAPRLARLAQELVQAIRDPLLVYKDYGLTLAEFEAHIRPNDFFKRAFEAYTIEWGSSSNTAQRLRMQSQAILEDNLPGFGARMADKAEALPAVVQAATLIAKMGGIGEDKQQVHPGEKFSIVINLGADTQQFTKTIGTPPIIDLEATPVTEKSDDTVITSETTPAKDNSF